MKKIKYDYSKLLGKMRECNYTQGKLADSIGVDESTLNGKLNNKSYFKSTEIDKICQVLNISNVDIGAYFFAQ